ncbi:MAG: carboxypeptidase-like regulatory domain-containing protein [Bacteroidia bacterium]
MFSFAQKAIVTGSVSDSTGRAVEGALISWKGNTSAVYTTADGKYSIEIPANKEIEIIVKGTGYNEFRKKVTLAENTTFTLNVRLKSIFVSDEKVVYGERSQGQTGVFMNPRIYDHLPSPSGDISAYLRFAGATSNNEMSTQYSVRGGNFDENLVYVNDIEVYRPFLTRAGQQEGLSFVNTDMTEQIYFSAGGFEAKYGDKMSSVLDIQYRRPSRFRAVATASLLGVNATVEDASEDLRFTWMLGLRQKSNRYLLNSLDTRGDYFANFTDAQLLATYYFSEHWNIEYLGNYALNRYNLVPSTRETEFGTLNNALRFTVYFDGRMNNRFQTMFNALALNYTDNKYWRHKFICSSFNTYETESFDIQGQYFIDQLEADFGKPTFGQVAFNRGVGTFLGHTRNYLDAWVNNAEWKSWYTNDRHSIWTGVRYQNEQITDQLSEWNYVDSAGYSIPYQPTTSIDLQDVVKSRGLFISNRVMLYGQYRFSDTLRDASVISITAGVRAHYWDLNGQLLVSPRVQMNWRPHWKKDIVFKAAGGIYSQPAFYRELRDYAGNTNRNIKAQTSVHALIGSDLNFKAWNRPFRFIAEAYYKYLDHIIPYEVNDVRIRYYGNNMAYGYAYGLDLKINGEFVKGTESWVNLSLLRTRENLYNDYYYILLNSDGDTIVPGYTFNNTPVDTITVYPGWIPRPTDQLVTFALYFQDYLPMLPDCKMNLGLIMGSGLPFGPPTHERWKQVFRMPPYRRVDIGFSYQIIKPEKPLPESNPFHIMKSLWFGLEVYNLLQVNNTISYFWVKDVTGRSYAVPNYLTNRQLSARMIVMF